MSRRIIFTLLCCIVGLLGSSPSSAQDPLPSWNDGPAKASIINFVEKVTKEGSPDFIPPAERVATFDNDGTLWCEQPAYFQLIFAIDRVKALAPNHPEWKSEEPFKSLLAGDMQGVAATGHQGIAKIVAASHAGMTNDEFAQIVQTWLDKSRHPKTGKRFDQMVYQPMLEVLAYLRANGFKTFIVSGGGAEFMRVFAEKAYGIPPEQIVGSRIKYKLELRDGAPVLARLPEIDLIDDGPGKPVGIAQLIGRQPVMAFGNSDGDLQMLEWTTMHNAGSQPRFALIVHHTDAEREFAYDRDSKIGRLDKGLTEGKEKGWTIVDMKNDWKVIFPTFPAPSE